MRNFSIGDMVYIKHHTGFYNPDKDLLIKGDEIDVNDTFIFVKHIKATVQYDRDLKYGEVPIKYKFDSIIFSHKLKCEIWCDSMNLAHSMEEVIAFHNIWDKEMFFLTDSLSFSKRNYFINQ